MSGFLVFLGLVAIVSGIRWMRLGRLLSPLFIHIGRDVKATAEMVLHHFSDRHAAEAKSAAQDLDDELRRFFGTH